MPRWLYEAVSSYGMVPFSVLGGVMVRIVWDRGWEAKLDKAVHDYVEDLAEDVFKTMVRTCPIDEGELLLDLDYEVQGADARIGARSVPHAIWAEEGTGPHGIDPVKKKALYWDGARHPVKHVNHPGYAGSHFMKNALYRAR